MKTSIKLLSAIALVVASASASAASFNFTDGTNAGNFSLNTTNISVGTEWATTGTLNVTGGVDTGTYTLVALGPTSTIPSPGVFFADNVVYTAGNPYLDNSGLLFASDTLGTLPQINIYGNGANNLYSFWSYVNGGYNVQNDNVTLTATPIPAAIWMVGSALAGAFGFMRRKLA